MASRASTPQSPRQVRASEQPAQQHPPQHHLATGIQGHGASPAGSRAVPSPTNTGAVGTRPEQPPGTAHPHMDPSPQPPTPLGASTHGHQLAASRAAATQVHPEPRPRHGTPDRPTAGPANAPPQDPPTQTRAAARTNTNTTRPSDTVHPHAHNLTEGPNPQAPATSSTAAPGDLPATAQAEPASQQHHAPLTRPAVRPLEPSSPGRLAPNLDLAPDPAGTTVPADALRSTGQGSRPGPPPMSEGHAREAARPADDAATPPAPPTQPQREEPTMGAEDMQGPPQRTTTPQPVAEPSRGVDQPAIQHAQPPGMAAHRSGKASTASEPGTEPEEPMLDTGREAGLHPPPSHGAHPAGRAGAAPLANPAHHTNASAQQECPSPNSPGTRAQPETTETIPDTPRRGAGRETSPSEHNPFRCLHEVLHG